MSAPDSVDVSVVIPARDEENHIGRTLSSVREALSGSASYEILVVDDGSTDRTTTIAEDHGARVLVSKTDTIGGSRNEGARAASGEVLVFLDADVSVTEGWGDRLQEILPELSRGSRLLTGRMCGVPDDAGWIERLWFDSRRRHGTHIGSGHMIVNRRFFLELGGFDASLRTGEDYELSMRVRRSGGEIRSDERLEAVHHGFPSTVRRFFAREVWHGTGDATSFGSLVRSKVVWAAMVFVALHLTALYGTLAASGWIVAAAVVGLVLLLGAAAVQKFGLTRGIAWGRILFLYYIYFWGRAVAVLSFRGEPRSDAGGGQPPGAPPQSLTSRGRRSGP